jgi:spoIIIJ-associated protein
MEYWRDFVQKFFIAMGFEEVRVDVEPDSRRIAVFIDDDYAPLKKSIMQMIGAVNALISLVARREKKEMVFIDINNYKRERERIIIDLARAAAKKAQLTKQEVPLPAMNAYERRLVHTELATRPDVKTESVGEGRGRYVVIKPLD